MAQKFTTSFYGTKIYYVFSWHSYLLRLFMEQEFSPNCQNSRTELCINVLLVRQYICSLLFKIQLSGSSSCPDVSVSQLIRVSGLLLYKENCIWPQIATGR